MKVCAYLENTYCITYGDDLADVDINGLTAQHRAEGKLYYG